MNGKEKIFQFKICNFNTFQSLEIQKPIIISAFFHVSLNHFSGYETIVNEIQFSDFNSHFSLSLVISLSHLKVTVFFPFELFNSANAGLCCCFNQDLPYPEGNFLSQEFLIHQTRFFTLRHFLES